MELQLETSSHNCYSSVTDFSVKLYQQVAGENANNLVISPNGVLLAVSMVVSGAGGETLRQLLEAVGFSSESELAAYVIGLRDELRDLVVIEIGRKLYTNLQLRSAFVSKTEEVCGGKVRKCGSGFRLSASEAIRQLVDAWLARHTSHQGECNKVLTGAVPESPCAVAACASVIQCEWRHKFHATEKSSFRNFMGAVRVVEMMRSVGSFPVHYHTPLKSTLVQLSYDRPNLSMWLLLPDHRVQLDFVEEALTPDAIETMLFSARARSISLSLPKFQLRSGGELKAALGALGVGDAFDPSMSNLSRMSYQQRVVLANVVHESALIVNERGTWAQEQTAAAATRSEEIVNNMAEMTSEAEEVTFDRPFLFFIHHSTLQQILFIGRVMDF